MAKRSSRNRTGRGVSNSQSRRYNPSSIYSPRLVVVPRFAPLLSPQSIFGDRRLYQPDRAQRPVFSFRGDRSARVVAKQNPRFKQPSQTKAVLAFAEPDALPLCVRRKVRKQVLHAKGVAGRKGLKRPRFNEWSKVQC